MEHILLSSKEMVDLNIQIADFGISSISKKANNGDFKLNEELSVTV